MGVSGVELLRQLGSGVRPEGGSAPTPALSLDGKSFASLMAEVGAGKISSGRPVGIGPHANVQLTESQLERLASVADAGEASGATRLGVMIDGQVVTLDILTRMVESAGDGSAVMTGIDGFVVAPPEGGAAGVVGGVLGGLGDAVQGVGDALGRGLGIIRNRSVAELLGSIDGDGDRDASGVTGD